MTLVRKYEGKKTFVGIPGELHARAQRFANKSKYTLGSVIETAIEDFLDATEDDDREKSLAATRAAKPTGRP